MSTWDLKEGRGEEGSEGGCWVVGGWEGGQV